MVAELEGEHPGTRYRAQQLVEVHLAKVRVVHHKINDSAGHVDPARLFDAFEAG